MGRPKIFKVEISDKTTYFIRDDEGELTAEDAERIAEEWFCERKPEIYTEELEASSFPAVDAYC